MSNLHLLRFKYLGAAALFEGVKFIEVIVFLEFLFCVLLNRSTSVPTFVVLTDEKHPLKKVF